MVTSLIDPIHRCITSGYPCFGCFGCFGDAFKRVPLFAVPEANGGRYGVTGLFKCRKQFRKYFRNCSASMVVLCSKLPGFSTC